MKKHKEDKKQSGKKKKKKNAKKIAKQRLLPAPDVAFAAPERGQLYPNSAIETYRSQWQYGQWHDLVKLTEAELLQDADRGKLAAIVAAAHSHLDNPSASRHFAKLALQWGCDRSLLARIMISAATNSLARCAASLEESAAAEHHFQDAIRLVEPRADAKLLGRTRQIRETARMGLLPDALATLEKDFLTQQSAPETLTARMGILQSDIHLLKHELMVYLQRGQLYGAATPAISADERAKGQSVSQLGQDLWVLERTGQKWGGFFVEFGATDGITLSNTWLLESQFGWTGICAEPNPKFLTDLRRNRQCKVTDACIGARTGDVVDFVMADVFGGITGYADADQHSEIRKAYMADGNLMRVTTVSLDDFLTQNAAPCEIDYLSIDTEGSEYDILAAFPFDRWNIRLITVEHNFTPARDKIYELLSAQGYTRFEAEWDDWYERTV